MTTTQDTGTVKAQSDIQWISYYFENNFTEYFGGGYGPNVWLWDFQAIVTTTPTRIISDIYIDIPQGEARSGRIPYLDYLHM